MTRRYILTVVLALTIVTILGILIINREKIETNIKKTMVGLLNENLPKGLKIRKITPSIFPLSINLQGIEFNDEADIKIDGATVYVSPLPLIIKELVINRAVVDNVLFSSDIDGIKRLIKKLNLDKDKEMNIPITVHLLDVNNIYARVKNGRMNYELTINNAATSFTTLMKKSVRIRISGITFDPGFRDEWVKKPVRLDVVSFSGSNMLDDYLIEDVNILSSGLKFGASGTLDKRKNLSIATDITTSMKLIKDQFDLNGSGEGFVRCFGNIEYDGKGLHSRLKVKGDIYLETLMELLLVKEKLYGRVDFHGDIYGGLKDLQAKGFAHMVNGNLFGVDIDSLTSDITYADRRMHFLNGDGRIYNGTAKAEAMITLPQVTYFTVKVDGESVDSKPLFGLIGWDPNIADGKVKGHVQSEGDIFDPSGWYEYISLDAVNNRHIRKVSDIKTEIRQRVTTASGSFDMKKHLLRLKNGQLTTYLSKARFEGTVNTENKTIDLKAGIQTTDVQDFSMPFRDDLKGGGEFLGTVTGYSEDPLMSGHITMDCGAKERTCTFFDMYFSKMSSDMSYSMKQFELRNGKATVNKGTVVFSGKMDFTDPAHIFDFNKPNSSFKAYYKYLDIYDISKRYADMDIYKGLLSADMTITGPTSDTVMAGDLRIDRLSVKDSPPFVLTSPYILRGRLADLRGMNLIFDDWLKGTKIGVNLNLQKRDKHDGWFNKENVLYDITSRDCSIILSNSSMTQLLGEAPIACEFKGKGRLAKPDITVKATIRDRDFNNIRLGGGSLLIYADKGKIDVKGDLFRDKRNSPLIDLKAGMLLDDAKTNTWKAEVTLNRNRYDFLLPDNIRRRAGKSSLELAGSLILSGKTGYREGTLQLSRFGLVLDKDTISNDSEIKIGIRNNDYRFNSMEIVNGDTRLSIGGSLTYGSAYNLTAIGTLYMRPLRILSDNIISIGGRCASDVTITGKWDNPEVYGTLKLSEGALTLKDLRYSPRSINGIVDFDKDKIIVRNLSVFLGGGTVQSSGYIGVGKSNTTGQKIFGKVISDFYLNNKITNLYANIMDGLNMNFNGEIVYSGNQEKQDISGQIKITQARYTGQLNWQNWTSGRQSETVNSNIFNKEKTTLNLNITANNTISFKNDLVSTLASADLLLRGTAANPTIFGKVETTTGKVFYRNNEFNIRRASIQFDGRQEFNPYVNAFADTTIKEYNIILNLYGYVRQLTLSYSSNPFLRDIEILSLLTTGNSANLTQEASNIGASDASTFISSQFQGILTDRFRNIIGLDRLMLSPNISNNLSTIDSQLTVSKWLIENKLYATVSSSIRDSNQSTIKMEYLLNRNFSVLGSRDYTTGFGGDVKFRLEFK